MMRFTSSLGVAVLVGLVSTAPAAAAIAIGAQQTAPPPDNSKVNKQAGLTADQQSQTKADLALVQQIRQAIMKDRTLSISAHNCKVITLDGSVTLRGPVNSEKEKNVIDGLSVKIAGAGKVTNLLEVKSSK